MDKQYMQSRITGWSCLHIQHKQCSLMHFWQVTVKRKRSNAEEQKEEEERGGHWGQWESGSKNSTCISLSARAALSYSAAKERNERTKKRDEEKVKALGHKRGKTTTKSKRKFKKRKEPGSQDEQSIFWTKCRDFYEEKKKKDEFTQSISWWRRLKNCFAS